MVVSDFKVDLGDLPWTAPNSSVLMGSPTTGAQLAPIPGAPGPAHGSGTANVSSSNSAGSTSSYHAQGSTSPWDSSGPICDATTGCNCDGDNEFSQLWSCCLIAGGPTPMEWDHDSRSLDYCDLTTLENTCGGSVTESCPGRCGRACLSPRKYMQDCLDHDWCVKIHGENPVELTGTCGDEILDAADDFIAVWGLGHRSIRQRLRDSLGYFENLLCTW